MSVLVTDFSGTYAAQGFLPWLQEQAGEGLVYRDFTGLEGTCCYCDAQKEINEGLPEELPRLRFIDSGDYHYMSHLLALRETQPFHLVLLDHHPDNQEPAFGGVLSCGSWVSAMQAENPQLRSVLAIGPDACPENLPEGWLEQPSCVFTGSAYAHPGGGLGGGGGYLRRTVSVQRRRPGRPPH